MATTWQRNQEEAAEFFRSIGLEATTNYILQGVRRKHAIDVYVRSHHVGLARSLGTVTLYTRFFRVQHRVK